MFKKLTLILLCVPALMAMQDIHLAQAKLKLNDGTLIDVPCSLVALSEILQECSHAPILLSSLTKDEWEILNERLDLAYTFFKEKTESAYQALLASLKKLSAEELLSCRRVARVLEVPVVFNACLACTNSLTNFSCKELNEMPSQYYTDTAKEGTILVDYEPATRCSATQVANFYNHLDIAVMCITKSGNIVSGSSFIGMITILDREGNQLATWEGHEDPIWALCVTPDGKIVSGSADSTVRVWDMEGNLLAVCEGHEFAVLALCVTPDGKIVSGSADSTVRVWDMEGNQLAVCEGHEDSIAAICVTSDGKIVVGSWGTLTIWDMKGSLLAVCEGHTGSVSKVCISPDGKIVSGAVADGTVRIWDIYGDQLTICKGHKEGITALCVTPNGKIVSGSWDKTVRIWDMEGNQLAVCEGHENVIRECCIASDGNIISGSSTGNIRFWDITTLPTTTIPLTIEQRAEHALKRLLCRR